MGNRKKAKQIQKSEIQSETSILRKWYNFQHNHPWRVIGFALIAFIASVMLMKFVGNEFAPSTDANEITVTARTPMGSTFEKSQDVAIQIENALKQFPEVSATTVKIGERGLQNISVTVELVDVSERNISDKRLAQKMLPTLAEIPDAEIQIRAGEARSNSVSADLVLNVYGEDDALRESYANQIIDIANKRIFLTHGHEYEVYYTKDFLLSKSIEINADIVIFGHTHIPYSSIKQNKYFFNPGSCERPRGESEKSYGIITIENQSINSSFFRITE